MYVLNVILFYLIYIPVNPFFLDFVFGYLGGFFFKNFKNGKKRTYNFFFLRWYRFFFNYSLTNVLRTPINEIYIYFINIFRCFLVNMCE